MSLETTHPTDQHRAPVSRARDDAEELRRVRAELTRIVEPGDQLAGLLVARLGAMEAHGLIVGEQAPGARLATLLAADAQDIGLGTRARSLTEGLRRWRTRSGQCDGARELATMRRFGGGLIIPEDPVWPAELQDLGAAAPMGLWHRRSLGRETDEAGFPALPWIPRTAAVVGSREVTDYGMRAAAEVVEDLIGHGVCVVSGGAYGVDAAAHRAALRLAERRGPGGGGNPPPTVAVLAGGLDRWYPAGNERLLQGVAEHGLLLSEMPPGSAPTKHRFLQRNRLIAALSATTVIVEARWRSGAQNTAHHALALGRPVGVVPGSIFSAASAGCHRLLRETPSTVVTDAADVVELMAGGEPAGAPAPAAGQEAGIQQALPLTAPGTASRLSSPPPRSDRSERRRPQDGMSEQEVLLHDALPRRGLSTPGKIAEVAGLPVPQVYAGLARLERSGHARQVEGRWGRRTSST